MKLRLTLLIENFKKQINLLNMECCDDPIQNGIIRDLKVVYGWLNVNDLFKNNKKRYMSARKEME